jgi:Tol biopolymer transport system component
VRSGARGIRIIRAWLGVAFLALSFGFGAMHVEFASAAFPGAPGLIALQRSADPNASDIWLLDWQTGAARRLTHRGYNGAPTFSPNGRWIAFRSDASWHGYLNIWAIRADGTGLHRLTKGKGELGAESPAFSANGRWVAFFAEPLGNNRTQIDRVALSGGHRQVLVAPGRKEYVSSPTYSPDGRHLAWVQGLEAPKAKPHIYIGDTLGRRPRRLIYGLEPQFSPDGRSIVYLIRGSCAKGVVGTEIATLSLETGKQWHVKASCGAELDTPTYSPDGTWIAYTVYAGEKSELGFTPVPLSTPSFTPLAGIGTDLPVDAEPSWQPAA